MVQHRVYIMSVNTNIKRDVLVKFVNELLLLGREKSRKGRNTSLFTQNTLLEVLHFSNDIEEMACMLGLAERWDSAHRMMEANVKWW